MTKPETTAKERGSQSPKEGRDFSPNVSVEGVERRGGMLTVRTPEGTLTSAAASCEGGRTANEDAVAQLALSDGRGPYGAAYLVADGMGGEVGGGEAAKEAIKRVMGRLRNVQWRGARPERIKEALKGLVVNAANEVKNGNTTFCAAVVVGETIYTIGIGDSRIYLLLKNGNLLRATTDHSRVEREIDIGELEPGDIYTKGNRSMIYKVFSGRDVAGVEVRAWKLSDIDTILVCSDGVWEGGAEPKHNFLVVKNGKYRLRREKNPPKPDGGWIGDALRHDPKTAVGELTAPGVGYRSNDNTTAIVVKINREEGRTPEAVTEPKLMCERALGILEEMVNNEDDVRYLEQMGWRYPVLMQLIINREFLGFLRDARVESGEMYEKLSANTFEKAWKRFQQEGHLPALSAAMSGLLGWTDKAKTEQSAAYAMGEFLKKTREGAASSEMDLAEVNLYRRMFAAALILFENADQYPRNQSSAFSGWAHKVNETLYRTARSLGFGINEDTNLSKIINPLFGFLVSLDRSKPPR